MKHIILENRFELLRELGLESWKSSIVYLAKDKKRKKNLALKLAPRDFKREYNILKRLKHKRIPKAYEHGSIKFDGKQHHYLLRDFVEGTDLHIHYKNYVFKNQKERAK